MKVPSLTEADLTKYHTWVSSEGNQIEALYMAASDNGVTLLMKIIQIDLMSCLGID